MSYPRGRPGCEASQGRSTSKLVGVDLLRLRLHVDVLIASRGTAVPRNQDAHSGPIVCVCVCVCPTSFSASPCSVGAPGHGRRGAPRSPPCAAASCALARRPEDPASKAARLLSPEYSAAFRAFDPEGHGHIDLHDLGAALQAVQSAAERSVGCQNVSMRPPPQRGVPVQGWVGAGAPNLGPAQARAATYPLPLRPMAPQSRCV